MHRKKRENGPARRVAEMGLLFALAVVLSLVEGILPVLPALPPGVKLGLSNIVTMFTLFYLGNSSALTLSVLKAFFVLLTRGPVASVMSLAGGLCSVAVMALLIRFCSGLSEIFVSISGAAAHNLGQLGAAALVLKSAFAFGYLPLMILSGIVMGIITAVLFKSVRPALRRLDGIVGRRKQ